MARSNAEARAYLRGIASEAIRGIRDLGPTRLSWAAAGDADTCPKCAARLGRTFDPKEIAPETNGRFCDNRRDGCRCILIRTHVGGVAIDSGADTGPYHLRWEFSTDETGCRQCSARDGRIFEPVELAQIVAGRFCDSPGGCRCGVTQTRWAIDEEHATEAPRPLSVGRMAHPESIVRYATPVARPLPHLSKEPTRVNAAVATDAAGGDNESIAPTVTPAATADPALGLLGAFCMLLLRLATRALLAVVRALGRTLRILGVRLGIVRPHRARLQSRGSTARTR